MRVEPRAAAAIWDMRKLRARSVLVAPRLERDGWAGPTEARVAAKRRHCCAQAL